MLWPLFPQPEHLLTSGQLRLVWFPAPQTLQAILILHVDAGSLSRRVRSRRWSSKTELYQKHSLRGTYGTKPDPMDRRPSRRGQRGWHLDFSRSRVRPGCAAGGVGARRNADAADPYCGAQARIAIDSGFPSSNIRLRIRHPVSTSTSWPSTVRAISPLPNVRLYR